MEDHNDENGAKIIEDEEAEIEEGKGQILKNRFRLSAISIMENEAKKQTMEIADPVVACIADLAYKFTVVLLFVFTELDHYMCSKISCKISGYTTKCPTTVTNDQQQLAKDVELFSQHAGRKSVNMEDVIISAHRNEHLVGMLRSFAQELKGKEPASEKKRKRTSNSKKSKQPSVDGDITIV